MPKPDTTFADALALQAVEAFVVRVFARHEQTNNGDMAAAILDELEAWQEAVPQTPDATMEEG